MKHVFRIVPAVLIVGLFIVALTWSGVDISKSTNYKTYELKYLVNLSSVEDAKKDSTTNDVKKELDIRLHKFDVANVSVTTEKSDKDQFVNMKFGTINNIKEIKNALSLNETFVIKEKLAVTPADETATPAEEAKPETTTEDTVKPADTENTADAATTETVKPAEPYVAEIEAKANEALKKMQAGDTFEIVAQNEVAKDPFKVVFAQSDWMYKDEIKNVLAEKILTLEPGQVSKELIKYTEPVGLGNIIDVYAIVKLIAKEEIDRSSSTPKLVETSHILVSYKDAMRAAETTTRSKDEAKTLADEIKTRLDNKEDFAALAKEFSDDSSNKNSGGVIKQPAGTNNFIEQFETAALKLENEGQLSEVVESPFGFHIIKANKITAATEESHKEPRVKFDILFFAVQPNEWKDSEITNKQIAGVDIKYTKEYDPDITINFTEEGKQMLKALTEKNMNNILGLFVGRELITSFTVQEINDKGLIKILRPATTKEADDLKAKLIHIALPAPVILVDEKDTTPKTEPKTEDTSTASTSGN